MERPKPGEQRGNDERGRGHACREDELSVDGRALLHREDGLAQDRVDPPRRFEKPQAPVIGHDPVSRAREEGPPALALEGLHLRRDGRLREMQQLRRRGDRSR